MSDDIVNADRPQEGTGLWRGPGERWPGPPGEHAPLREFSASDIGEQFVALQDSIANLGRLIVAATAPDPPSGVASGNTDASGNLWLPIYTVAAGLQFRLTRATVEAQGSTPIAPSSAGWFGFYASQLDGVPTGTFTGLPDALQGSLKDFAPSVAGGATFPALFVDEQDQALEIRGPNRVVLAVFGGPVTKRVTVNYQGHLRRAAGVE